VHEAVYPLTTSDFRPLLDEVASSECDLLFLCSYIQDSIDLIRALHAHSWRPKMVGASMIGPQSTKVRTTLGPLLNGVVNYEYWVPVPSMIYPGVETFLGTYRKRAAEENVDLLGHYMAPLAYAQMQVVAQAISATGGLEDQKLSDYSRYATFHTVMGNIQFGANGEWREPRVVQVQFQGIDSSSAEQFRDGSKQVVVSPEQLTSGSVVYPYSAAL
jgi:branched-chain amino acid transport system substrate-binding protein